MADTPKEASKIIMGIAFIIGAVIGWGVSSLLRIGERISKLIDNFTPVSNIKWVPPLIGIAVYLSIAVLAWTKLTGNARAGAVGVMVGATVSELTTL